jgi:hypothetical protein
MRKVIATLAVLAATVLAVPSVPVSQALAQSAVPQVRVKFPAGSTSTVVVRTIRGRETIDFVVNAKEGQRLVASMTSNNRSAYFNIIAPGEQDVAFYAGDRSSPLNRFSGTVPRSGDVKFRVYLFRSAARMGQRATIRLSISITGAGGTATQLPGHAPGQGGAATHLPGHAPGHGGTASQLPGDALVPGTNYNATAQVPCSFANGATTSRCEAGVRRKAGADGTTFVEIRKPDGRTRVIFFRGTAAYGADSAQADGSAGWVFHTTRRGDESVIGFGPESYVIPDAFVVGG